MTAFFVQDGNSIDHTPGADVAAGEVVVQGELVGVAKLDIPAGRLGALAVSGVFDLAKAAGSGVTFSAGDKVYWDASGSVAVATDGSGANKLVGKAVADAADGDSTVRVRLSQ
jgi:predicted RecA/RadA family phage recombinase